MSEETGISIKKTTLWKFGTFLFLGLFVISLFTGGFGNILSGKSSVNGNVVAVPSNPTPTGVPSQPSQVSASVDDDAVLGNKDAPVTIIEFSDYQCPFCRKFWTETLPSIKTEYIDTGKAKLVYRDLPLTSIHPAAQPAAEAAECAREKGGDSAYFKMHDKIFQEQNKIDGGDPNNGPVRGTAQFGATELKQWAKDLGYDIGSCLDSGKYRNEIQKDLADATAAGGQGTPYFVINGKPLSGAQPFSAFKQVIDAELSG